jgi:hypothetical protein
MIYTIINHIWGQAGVRRFIAAMDNIGGDSINTHTAPPIFSPNKYIREIYVYSAGSRIKTVYYSQI